MDDDITYLSLLNRFGVKLQPGNTAGPTAAYAGLPCGEDYTVLSSLLWHSENLEVLRRVPMDAMRKLLAGAHRYIDALHRQLACAPASSPHEYGPADELKAARDDALGVLHFAGLVMSHLANGVGEHPAEVLIRERDARRAAEAAEAAAWSGFNRLRSFDATASRMEDCEDLWCTLNALVEVGVPMELLDFETVQTVYCHITEPNCGLLTEADDSSIDLLNAIGMRYAIQGGGSGLMLLSDGVGYDFLRGCPADGSLMYDEHERWRQVPTSTVEQVHLALLACSDNYWHIMPARMKTPEAIDAYLLPLFKVNSVSDIPRPAIREQALAVLAGQASPIPSLPACMH